MKRVLSFKEHQKSIKIAEDLIEMIVNPKLNESEDTKKMTKTELDRIISGLAKDLKFNFSLIGTFGTGIGAMIPVVDNLIKNGNLKIEATLEKL